MNRKDENKVASQIDGRKTENQNHESSAAETNPSPEGAAIRRKTSFDEWWREYEEKMGARLEFDAELAA